MEDLELYKKCLKLPEADFQRIEHEEAMVAKVYAVTAPAGKFILKISDRPNDYYREVFFLKQLVGKLKVPKIIQAIPPSTQNTSGAILMERLPGSLLKIGELTTALAFEIGQNLALIHLNRLPGYGDPHQHTLSQDQEPYFTLKFEEGLAECSRQFPKRLLERCRQYYAVNVHLLREVDGPCFAHRDYRPGNLMVHEGKLQGVIDWARARASFAEEDFCSIEHGEWISGPELKQALLAGYERVRTIPNYAPLIPFLRLNKIIAIMGLIVRSGSWQNSASRLYQYNMQALETLLN